MTLTQTIAAPWGIWQCADYRLVNRQTGEVHEDWSHKFLDVFCNDGRALITYTGIGRLDFQLTVLTFPSGWRINCTALRSLSRTRLSEFKKYRLST